MTTSSAKEIPVAIAEWLTVADPASFPYRPIVEALRRRGKHFADPVLLDLLATIRDGLGNHDTLDANLLRVFLDNALDKRDGSYCYATYTALGVLALTRPANGGPSVVLSWRDRLYVELLADVLAAELGIRPMTVAPDVQEPRDRRRVLLTLRALAPAARRLGVGVDVTADPDRSRRLVELVFASTPAEDRLALLISLLPVDAVHEELMFIRILQASELTFAAVASSVADACDCLRSRALGKVFDPLDNAVTLLEEVHLLFPLLATMPVESFRRFREFTVGASAIQSEAFKYIESRCATPPSSRLQSVAYDFVPVVRDEALSGRPTVDDWYRSIVAADVDGTDLERLEQLLSRLNTAWHLWKRIHHGIAKHFLGSSGGTGYTEGPPYLAADVDAALVPSVRAR